MSPDGGEPGPDESGRAGGLFGLNIRTPELRKPDFNEPGRDSFRLLFATLLVVGVGNSMLLAVLPSLARELSLSAAQMGWVFSFSALLWVLCSPVWGKRSDVWGRKPTIVLGLAAYGVSMAGIASVVEIGLLGWIGPTLIFVLLILTRAIFGAFGSAANPAAQAYIADHTKPEHRTEEIAALTSAFALGSAVGPGLCALAAGWIGPVAPLIITAALAGLGAWAIWRFLPEAAPTEAQHRDRAKTQPSWRLAMDQRVSAHLLFGLGLSAITAVMAQIFGFYIIDRLNLSPRDAIEPTAAGFMVGALAVLTAQTVLLPRLKMAPRGLMILGSVLVALGIVIQIFAPTLGALLVAQLVQGFGFGLARPGFTGGASLAVRMDEQGSVAGLIVGVSGAGFVLSPLAGGWLYDAVGKTAPLWLCFGIVVAMGLFAWRSRRLRAGESATLAPDRPDI